MKALILAAGMGARLGKLTSERPKALVKVAGTCLIDHILEFASHPKIEKIGVVTGYGSELLTGHLKGRDVRNFYNQDYKEGNIFSLKSALDFVDDDLLMMNVDHIYPAELLAHILKNARGICAMCDFDRTLVQDDMKVELDASKKLKKISKQLKDYDGGYIGMTYCAKEMTGPYKEAVEDTLKIYGKSSCVEFVLGHLAANGVEINICDTSGFRWLEVDTPEDLETAEAKLRGKDETLV